MFDRRGREPLAVTPGALRSRGPLPGKEPAGWTDYNASADEVHSLPTTPLGAVRAEVQTALPFAIASPHDVV